MWYSVFIAYYSTFFDWDYTMNDIIFFKNFRFNQYRFDENRHSDNSKGVGFHFICFLQQGRGRLVSGDKIIELRENDMFYIPKGCCYHSYWIAEEYVCFDSIGFLYFPTETGNGYALQKIACDPAVATAFAALKDDKTVRLSTIGALYTLLGILESRLEKAPPIRDMDIYEKALLCMLEDPQKTIPHYAKLCGISESALYQYTKRITGKTPNRIRQEILCQKATELLVTTNASIEQICDRLGFSSAAYFRRIFHSICGKSPTQVRKENNTI